MPFLHAVHRHGSVAEGARALGYTPSAVSQQIGKLEREVGAMLLEPAGRGVVLTDAALVLVDAAEVLQAAGESAQARIDRLDDQLTGSLRVACLPSVIRVVAAPALGDLASTAPQLRVQLREMAPDEGMEAVAGGQVDVAVVHDWEHERATIPAGMDSVHLVDDPVDLVVPAAHPLAARTSVDLLETVDEVWATDVSGGICTRWIIALLRSNTEHPRINFRAEEYASQIALVAAGLCVMVLPRMAKVQLPPTVRVMPLRGEAPTRRLLTVHRRATARRPAVERFVTELQRRLA